MTTTISPYAERVTFTHPLRRVLRHVEPGQITVTARWGSRTAKASVEVGEAKETSLRIELPDPR